MPTPPHARPPIAVTNDFSRALKERLEVLPNPNDTEAQLDAVIQYVMMSSHGTPQEVTIGFFNVLPLVLKGSKALLWWNEQRTSGVVWSSLDEFARAFKERFCRQVRFQKQDARMQFALGKVTQGNRDIQNYTSRFKRCVQQAGDMSVTDQVFWYLEGLHPDLLDKCATDTTGLPWDRLAPLIDYAYGQEMAMKTSKKAVKSQSNAAHSHVAPVQQQFKAAKSAPAKRSAPESSTPRSGGPSEHRSQGAKKKAKVEFKAKGDPNELCKWGPASHLLVSEYERRMNHNLCFSCGAKLPPGGAREHNCQFRAEGMRK
jgi:hypothetical protein